MPVEGATHRGKLCGGGDVASRRVIVVMMVLLEMKSRSGLGETALLIVFY